MGRDIWVALERKDNDGPWYNTDMFFTREDGPVRVPFYTGRSSALFDVLHEVSSPIMFKDLSRGTQNSLVKEMSPYIQEDDKSRWTLETVPLETLRVYYEDLLRHIKLSFKEDPEWLDTNEILELESFLKDLTEYIRVTLRDEYFGQFGRVFYRVIFFIC